MIFLYAFTQSNRFFCLTLISSNGVSIGATSEILPRQQFLSVPFAISAANANAAAMAASVLPGSITTASITPGLIQTTNIAIGAVTFNTLAPRQIGTSVGLGGLSMSLGSGNYSSMAANVDVPNLTVTLATTGRPVFVGLIPDGTNFFLSSLGVGSSGSQPTASFGFTRDGILISSFGVAMSAPSAGVDLYAPPGSASYVDTPIAGTHTYTFRVVNTSGDWAIDVSYVRLVAYEF